MITCNYGREYARECEKGCKDRRLEPGRTDIPLRQPGC